MAELIVTLPTGKRRRYALTLKPQDIGRDPSCHIHIDDATISRRHADIRGDASGQFMIRDLGSKNGTLVNDLAITTKPLADGDEIVFGSISARFCLSDSMSTGTISVDQGVTLAAQAISSIGPQNKLLLSQKRLEMLYEISARLTGLRNRQELFSDILKICIETFDFERATIGVKSPDGRGMKWPVVHNMQGADGEIKISRTILMKALEEGQRVILSDTRQELADPTMSIVQQGTRSAMCVPIAYSDQILGVIYGDRTSTTRKYEKEDVDFLAALARQASIGLTNARLLEEQEQKVFLEKEITIARQIQSDLFPETLDVHAALEIAAINEPGQQVSGDYYDILRMRDGAVGLVIADVTGKGVASALIAANLQAAVRVLMPETQDLAALAERLNLLVYHNTDTSRFITAVLAIIDPSQHQLRFVTAGHFAPMRISAPQQVEITSQEGNLPFGVEADTQYNCVTIDLGDQPNTLFFYTDGLNEAMNDQSDEFGTPRILEVLQKNSAARPHTLISSLRQEVADFCGNVPQRDDITMIAVQTK